MNIKDLTFLFAWNVEDDCWLVTIPQLNAGPLTHGNDLTHAMEMAIEAAEAILEIENNPTDIPEVEAELVEEDKGTFGDAFQNNAEDAIERFFGGK